MSTRARLAGFADRLTAGTERVQSGLRRLCWGTAPARAAAEAGLLMLFLLLVVLSPMLSAPKVVVPATLLLFALMAGTVAGLRMRLFTGSWRGALLREALFSIPLAALMILITAGVWWVCGAWRLVEESIIHPSGLMLVPAMCIPAFLTLRVFARLWRWWNEQRKRHFLWALTHAQLTVVVLVGLLLMLIGLGVIAYTVNLELNDLASLPGDPSYSVFMQVIIWLLGLAFLTLAFTGGGVLLLFPVALVFAYLVGRGLTRRVETLAQAAARLRAGDFEARVPVQGQDELAQLQADFNHMAEDLQQRTRELQAERDRSAALLHAHRQLVAAVSHELRTPVATARTYLDALLQPRAEVAPEEGATASVAPEGGGHDLAIVSAEIDRLERLIDDLFTLSRAEVDRLSLTLAPVAVAPLLRSLVGSAEKAAWDQRRVQVTQAETAPELLVVADAGRLEQIVRNLLQNGLRHTPPGGYVLVSAEPVGAEVEIRVEDSGEGIAAEDLPYIWDRFYRTASPRQTGEGAGLGLALVKELAEAMGGSVGVESCLGEGSRFWVRLPQQPRLP